MDLTTRFYARRIVMLHVGLLLAVVGLVSLASYEVFNRARDQMVAQAKSRQELLAKQTASAIESYYKSIAADLNFLRRSEDSTGMTEPRRFERGGELRSEATTRGAGVGMRGGGAAPPAPRLLHPLWNQLEGRASHLLIVHRQTLAIMHAYPEDTNREDARVALQPFGSWLRDLDKAGVSPFRPTRDGGANLIAVPLSADYVLAAVVPVLNVEEQFFRVVRDRSTLATLLDENGVVMVTSDLSNPTFAPATLPTNQPTTRPARRILMRMKMAELQAGTTEYRDPTPVPFSTTKERGRGAMVPPHLTTVEPLNVDARTFYVIINSPLSDITAAATTLFTRAFIGAIFVILSVTAILLSTAMRLIRARQRLETLQHEMLTKELDQARAIQLNWLPSEARCPADLRIAAVNRTANHISGDFYDWFTLPDGRAVVSIGDVTGHGMSAAFLMATTQLLVRNTLPQLSDPARCLESVNRQLCAQSFQGQFVTIFLMIVDSRSSTVVCATAGHMPPLVRSSGGGFAAVQVEPQLPLGIDSATTYQTEVFGLPRDSNVVLYTDGITDAAGPDGSRFGIGRLMDAVDGVLPAMDSPRSFVDEVLEAVDQFRANRALSDDVTLVVLTFSPAAVSTINRGNPVSIASS